MVKVKICGITGIDDALSCSEAGADALGFIFYKQSPRYIIPQRAKKILDVLGPFVTRVGVFVDEEKDVVRDIAHYLNLDVLQFHGSETPGYCIRFLNDFKVIKTFFPPQFPDSRYIKVDAYLFDIRLEDKKKAGGVLKESFLKKIKDTQAKRIILSGGLNPHNILGLIKKVRPYAVDVASGVEAFPGKKDETLVSDFIKRVKHIKD